jgi:hypothetical protein
MEKRKSLTKKEIDTLYIEGYIDSMENDYPLWKLETYCGMDGDMFEYKSPEYGDIIYGFGYNYNGVWIDGFFEWSLPYSVCYNPFNKYFWRYHIARRNLKKHKINELKQKYYNRLHETFKKTQRKG